MCVCVCLCVFLIMRNDGIKMLYTLAKISSRTSRSTAEVLHDAQRAVRENGMLWTICICNDAFGGPSFLKEKKNTKFLFFSGLPFLRLSSVRKLRQQSMRGARRVQVHFCHSDIERMLLSMKRCAL